MGRKSNSRALSIWANGERVGTWVVGPTGDMELRYDAAWKQSAAGRPLSLSLPFGIGERPLRGERVHNYFDNLLPDSPQIRLRRGIQAAADMAPNAWYQAPKVAELVNNTGDGARRERVISGGGTYCMTERAPTTSIDMIEKHGKWRQTNCPEHESTASSQEWRTARD